MLLSLSGFLFEDNYVSQSVDFPAFCNMAKSFGYDGIELRRTQVSPDTPAGKRKEILRIAKDHGLPVTCLTARGLPEGGPERDAFFQKYLDLCCEMDCRLMKINSDAAWCREAAARAEKVGVVLAVNNHINSPQETVEGTREFFREVNHPNFGLLYDGMHLSISGEDYLGCIPEFAGVTKNILVHSFRPSREGEGVTITAKGKPWLAVLPDDPGAQDWRGVFAAFRRQGYDGLVTVFECGWPPERRRDVARRCANVVRKFWQTSR